MPTMREPQLTSVFLAIPERLQALSHVVDQINEFLKPETIDSAVYNDCQYVVRVHGTTRKWTKNAMNGAAARGRLDIVKWLNAVRNEGCTIVAMDEAVVNGHVGVVKWLRVHYFGRCSSAALNAAAKNGHSEVVKCLCCTRNGQGPYEITDGVQVAAARGDIGTLSVLMHENCSSYYLGRALEEVAAKGQRDAVKVLLSVELQQPSVSKALRNAVSMNHMDVVELLVDHCSSAEIRTAYPTITMKNNAKIGKVLRGAIKRRIMEEKWGYFTTQSNILEGIKASRDTAVRMEKAAWLCGMFRTW